MDEKSLLNQLVDELVERADERQKEMRLKHDLPAGFTVGTNYMHGPTGIFGAAGLEPYVFSTRVQSRGLMATLPAYGTVDTNPLVPFLTGFTDETGSEPTAPCDEPPEAGEMKSCLQGSVFGLVQRKTKVLELNQVGRRTNRGEYYDLQMVNDPILETNFAVPTSIPKAAQQVLNREVFARWMALGIAFENKLGKLVWTGDPANNTAQDGYMEFYGFESLVKTGHVDVITNTSCPSLNSDIKDFNWAAVENNAYGLFLTLTMLFRFVKHNAETMNMMPVSWAWVMQDALFRIVCDLWPCVYSNARCTAGGNANSILASSVDATAMREMADAMYNGRFLRVDGVDVPVILDDYIPYDTNATDWHVPNGSFASDIYLIPLSVKGGRQVTFFEYYDFSAPNGVTQAIADGHLTDEYWTDGGKFLWTYSRTNWCVSWHAKIEPRLRLLTPHLAGRLQNVVYTPLQMFRMPHNDDPYFVDGGDTSRSNYPYTLPPA